MKKKSVSKSLRWMGAVVLFLVTVLVVHIAVVTGHPAPDASTRVMARIDINKSLDKGDGDRITAWLYRQKGVDHVLCNDKTGIAIFTYSPLIADGNEIAGRFRTELDYPQAKRYVPTEKEMRGGCPVATTSFSYRVVSALRKIF